jgi:hypothetical protein
MSSHINPHQEPKYDFNPETGQFYNRHTGSLIPLDEPIFILRAQDKAALEILRHYGRMIERNSPHGMAVEARIKQFKAWRERNAAMVKKADTHPSEAAKIVTDSAYSPEGRPAAEDCAIGLAKEESIESLRERVERKLLERVLSFDNDRFDMAMETYARFLEASPAPDGWGMFVGSTATEADQSIPQQVQPQGQPADNRGDQSKPGTEIDIRAEILNELRILDDQLNAVGRLAAGYANVHEDDARRIASAQVAVRAAVANIIRGR